MEMQKSRASGKFTQITVRCDRFFIWDLGDPSKTTYSDKDGAIAKSPDGTDICVSAGCVTAGTQFF